MDSKDSSNNPESKPDDTPKQDASGWELPDPANAPPLGPPGDPWGTAGSPASDWNTTPPSASSDQGPRQTSAATVLEANSADLIAAAMAQANTNAESADPAFAATGAFSSVVGPGNAPDASGWGVEVTDPVPSSPLPASDWGVAPSSPSPAPSPEQPRQARAATVLEANSADLIAAAMAQAESEAAPSSTGGFGAAPASGFGATPPTNGFGAAPPTNGFGAAPPSGGSGFGSSSPPSDQPPSQAPPANAPPASAPPVGQNLPAPAPSVALTPQEIEEGKTLAILSHAVCFFPLFLLPLLQKDNRFALFHSKQAIISFAAFWGISILGGGGGVFMCPPIGCLAFIAAFVPAAVGAYWAYSGEVKQFPLAGELIDDLLEDVKVNPK